MHRVLRSLFVILSGLCVGCGNPSSHGYKDWREYRKAEVAARQKQAQPVVDALEKYKAARGNYPDTLDELVAGKFIDAVPDLASKLDHQGKPDRIESAEPLTYNRDGDRYRLVLQFLFAEKARGSQMEWGTSDEFASEYWSDTKVWGPRRITQPRP